MDIHLLKWISNCYRIYGRPPPIYAPPPQPGVVVIEQNFGMGHPGVIVENFGAPNPYGMTQSGVEIIY